MAGERAKPGFWQDDLELISFAAEAAGKIALGYFRKDVEVFWKNGGKSPVTAADLAANKEIAGILKRARPHYGWMSEENEDDARRLETERVFVVDPIDGTRGFMKGLDSWCVSIAVVEAGRPVAGVLYAPALSETYLATADGMIMKNGKTISTAGLESGRRMTVSGVDELFERLPADVMDMINRKKTVPSLAYRLAMVADGQLDATLVKSNSHDWDIAAADLILTNAGGSIIDEFGAVPVYNRPSPKHGIMCAASREAGPRLMPVFMAG